MRKILGIICLILLIFITFGYYYWSSKATKLQVGSLHTDISLTKPKLRLIAMGDYGTGDENQAKVAAAMERYCQQYGLDGLLLLGDNVYMDGVASLEDPKWDIAVWQPLGSPCLSQVPLYPILGNHDYKGSTEAQIAMTAKNPRWHMPNRFYSIKFGNLLKVVGLDTNICDFCFDPKLCVLDFLKQSLGHDDSHWTFVMGHHPVSSASSKHKDNFQGKVLKRFLCDKADAYLAGHSHHLEFRKEEDCQADLFISGAGGASLYPPLEDPKSVFAAGEFGFLAIDVSRDTLEYKFFNYKDELLYTHTVSRTSEGTH
ncbi:MAG: hypothetical protein CMP10_07855 [Zetaproteobacteria bacterium]|nr:hypothetical protein [Pseudobdellovibrionaceae bacterium]